MTATEVYQDELAALRGLLAQPVAGLHLLEFATMPQLEGILAELRPLCGRRGSAEITYDPPREHPGHLIERLREQVVKLPSEPPPLVFLHPVALPDATRDGPAAMEFWKAINFRREALGNLHAQILLCVDPWHHAHLVDEALDLLSWCMPRFHLIPPPDAAAARTEMLTGNLVDSGLSGSAQAAESRWATFWPILENLRRKGPLPSSAIRRYVIPLLESSLAVGNLVRARQVRDVVGTTSISQEDLIPWHRLNALLAAGAGDASLAEIHAEKLLELVDNPSSDGRATKAAESLITIANVLDSCGFFDAELRINQRLVAYFNAHLGPKHLHTLGSRMNLATTLDSLGKHEEAESELRDLLTALEQMLGPEHLDTLTARNNLAIALDSQGKHDEAELEQRAVLALRERILGSEDSDTLSSRNNLASALFSQGKLAEAEREYRAVLAMMEHNLGQENPKTLGVCGNLSITLMEMGRKAEALELARRVLAGREKIFGENHPNSQKAKWLVEDLESK